MSNRNLINNTQEQNYSLAEKPLLAVFFVEKVVPADGIRFNAKSFFYQTESVTLRNLDKPMPVVV